MTVLPVTLVIPTYGREEILLDTVRMLLAQNPPAADILVVDQTVVHEEATVGQLGCWNRSGEIRWIRLDSPSQPGALNVAIQASTQPFLIFLDDDIRIEQGFVKAHYEAFSSDDIWAVAGQVLQPGENPENLKKGKAERWGGKDEIPKGGNTETLKRRNTKLRKGESAKKSGNGLVKFSAFQHFSISAFCSSSLRTDLDFPFCSATKCFVQNGMSGNLCVRRERALEIGGFDENFIPPVAYRFDADFCKRLSAAGGRIVFEPAARIFHLRAQRGGTRTSGNHLSNPSPMHSVGDYYFALRHGQGMARVMYIFRRLFKETINRYYLRHLWLLPKKLWSECQGLSLAFRLCRKKPHLISETEEEARHE